MKVTVKINDKDVEIELTKDQVDKVKKSNQKVTDRIKTFEDVLEDNNISELDFKASCKGLTEDEVAYRQVKLITKSLCEKWVPNWNNSDEYKYTPYFDMRKDGCCFSHSSYDSWGTYTGVGSRLCFPTSVLAEYAGKTFPSIYEKFLK